MDLQWSLFVRGFAVNFIDFVPHEKWIYNGPNILFLLVNLYWLFTENSYLTMEPVLRATIIVLFP